MGTSINCSSIAATWDNLIVISTYDYNTYLLDKNSGTIYQYYMPSGKFMGKRQLIELGENLSDFEPAEQLGQ